MFGSVFSNESHCKELLERILDIDIIEIEVIDSQKTIQNRIYSKGSRLDVYVKDSKGNYYSIEMQTTDTHDLHLRSRYYHSQMDSYHIKKGEKDYSKFPESMVIFICTFDYFGKGRSIYRFENTCIDDHSIFLNERRTTIFINIFGTQDELTEGMVALLDYFKTGRPTDHFTSCVQADVEMNREDDEWRDNYMTIEMLIETRSKLAAEQSFERGMKEGIEKGIEEGIEKSHTDIINRMLTSGMSAEQIADICGLDLSEVEAVQQQNETTVLS